VTYACVCLCVWCVRFYFGCVSMCASINKSNNNNNNSNNGNKRQKSEEAKKLKMKYQQPKMTGWLTCRNFEKTKFSASFENTKLSSQRLLRIQNLQFPLFIRKCQRIARGEQLNRPKTEFTVSCIFHFANALGKIVWAKSNLIINMGWNSVGEIMWEYGYLLIYQLEFCSVGFDYSPLF